jgi:tyrosyl-tRNA synthetase
LLEGTDGVRKMSKSYGNYIGVAEPPEEMFGKLMSISDELMARYIELLTDWDLEEARAGHPMETKKRLATEIIARYHGVPAADAAREAFVARFSRGETPEDVAEQRVETDGADVWLPDLLVSALGLPSKSEARRRIQSGAVSVDGERLTDPQARIAVGGPYLVKAGKRSLARVTVVGVGG